MNKLRPEATALRDAGFSYSYIASELGITKSTLSTWFRDRPFEPNTDTLTRVKLGQSRYGKIKKQARLDEIKRLQLKGFAEVGPISERDLWMIGLGLWLGEGSKTVEQIRLANSDPQVIRLWMKWLREVCKLSDANITARMHLYRDSDHEICLKYWQSITSLPLNSFRKTQIDARTTKAKIKKGKLPHGTLHLSVVSNKNPDLGVRLHRRMMGWVSAIIDSQSAGVV